MERLGSLDSLNIREKKHYSHMPEHWKLQPFCCFSDISEEEIYYMTSEDPGVSNLEVFRKSRAFSLYLLNKKGEQIFSFEKHTGLFSDKLEVFDASEDLLGYVEKQKTHFKILDAGGHVVDVIEASPEDPETFYIRKGTAVVGKLSRRPCRLAEEDIPKRDHFGIVFPFDADTPEKGVLIGALFLIDLMF
ncbi:MAG: phospholipid scramblase-related protein [Candidatus Omnitrophota bacterium]